MPRPLRTLTLQGARDQILQCCGGPPTPAAAAVSTVGLETEWLIVGDDPAQVVGLESIEAAVAAAGPLPHASRITYEPGGQLELSGPPSPGTSDAIAGMADDLAAIDRGLQTFGLRRLGSGIDPSRPPVRLVDSPRYRAMETFFDTDGQFGRTMMCSTASIQVNVGGGDAGATDRRARLAHTLGPTLVAAFANSPIAGGRPTRWPP